MNVGGEICRGHHSKQKQSSVTEHVRRVAVTAGLSNELIFQGIMFIEESYTSVCSMSTGALFLAQVREIIRDEMTTDL